MNGKELFSIKIESAYNYFENATKIDPKTCLVWIGMYMSYDTQKFHSGITVINKLIEFDPKYKRI
jgi:hypothetical protein